MKDEKSYSLDRRQFLSSSALVAAGLLLTQSACGENEPAATGNGAALAVPLVVSTWAPNVKANAAAWKVLEVCQTEMAG
jgi:N4-(beta-N-acetylglucosaminyl)-L-asparaginase